MAETRATSLREWAIAVAGGLALAAGLVIWLRPPAPRITPPATERAPPPAAVVPAPAPPAARSTPSSPPPLILRGVLPRSDGGSAILEDEGGSQRLVGLGRTAAPGWQLAALDATSATLEASDGTRHRLFFETTSGAIRPAEKAPQTMPAPVQKVRVEELAATSTAYRLALRPVRGDTGITGWAVQTPETVPLFRLAGLNPGDVLLAVNGRELFSEEKIIELPQEINDSNSVELRVDRGGENITVRLDLLR
ncbi:MAG: hypothetical protein ACMVO5_07430 [Polymorphobacter sp.]|uniref:hypothetical protein n=1 Tax=Polymorphobacter sp. TaxID=1909290 RepID=UPI003A848465